MAAPRSIQVDGLREWQRDLRRIDAELPRELRKVNKSVADLIVDDARARAISLGGVAAHVAPSLKSEAQSASAAVKLGSNKYPMAAAAEFGSGQDSRRNRRPHDREGAPVRGHTLVGWRQFPQWTGNDSDAGRFLYPSIRARQPDVIRLYGDAVERLANQAAQRAASPGAA